MVRPASEPGAMGPEFDSIHQGRQQWEKKYGYEHASAMEAFSNLTRTRELLVDSINSRLAALDLSWIDYDLLSVIEFIGGGAMALGKIRRHVRRFVIHQTSISNAVARLTDRGILATTPDAIDGRVTLVELTSVGRRRLRRAHQVLAEFDFGLSGLSESQQRMLIDLLYAIRLDHHDVHSRFDERST